MTARGGDRPRPGALSCCVALCQLSCAASVCVGNGTLLEAQTGALLASPLWQDSSQAGATALCDSWEGLACDDNCLLVSVDLVGACGPGTEPGLPAQWSTLTGLQTIDLSSSCFAGPLPKEWSTLTGLTQLRLAQNSLTGPLPAEWSILSDLRLLDLGSNHFTGTLPTQWSSLSALEGMSLLDTMMSGSLPAQWSTLTQLETLHISGPLLTGSMPESWVSLPVLSSKTWDCFQAYTDAGGNFTETLALCSHCATSSRLAWQLSCPWLAPPHLWVFPCACIGLIAIANLILSRKDRIRTSELSMFGLGLVGVAAFNFVRLIGPISNALTHLVGMDNVLLLQSLNLSAVMVIVTLGWGFTVGRYAAIRVLVRLGLLPGSRNWTMVASEDVFRESEASIKDQQAAFMRIGISLQAWGIAVAHAVLPDLTSTGVPLEKLSLALVVGNLAMMTALMLVTLILPDATMTNQIVSMAISRFGGHHIRRVRECQWPTAFVTPLVTATISPLLLEGKPSVPEKPYSAFSISGAALLAWVAYKALSLRGSSQQEVRRAVVTEGFLYIAVLLLAVLLFVLLIPDTPQLSYVPLLVLLALQYYIFFWWLDRGKALRRFASRLWFLATCGRVRNRKTADESRRPRGQGFYDWLQQRRPRAGDTGVVFYRRLTILCALWVHALPQISTLAVVLTWTGTVALMIVHCLLADSTAGFGDLEEAPAFGLVLSAVELEQMLTAWSRHLQSGGAASLLDGSITTYKATVFRMARTLAVSYRWQAESVCISSASPDSEKAPVRINMSHWQLTQLLQALKRSQLRYVWLDVLCVPQPPLSDGLQRLQRTLLARMLAVYAGAGASLVLRSSEAEMERYHQRAWTFQEFCASQKLYVVDETPHAEDAAGANLSCTTGEVQESTQLRATVQRSMSVCRPLWISAQLQEPALSAESSRGRYVLRPGDSLRGQRQDGSSGMGCLDHIPDLDNRVRQYLLVSSQLQCREEADRVRALLPVLLNCPVEHHAELVCVVEHLLARFPEEGIARAFRAITGLTFPSAELPATSQSDVKALEEITLQDT